MKEMNEAQRKLYDAIKPPKAEKETIANALSASLLTTDELAEVIDNALEVWQGNYEAEVKYNRELLEEVQEIKNKIADRWLEGR